VLERAILAISPSWAARRAWARLQYQQLRAYEGGRVDRRTAGIRAPDNGANAQIGPYIRRLRARSRQLVRDNPYANRIVRVREAHEIGHGITPRSATGVESVDKKVDRLWADWAARCDVNGQLDFYAQQALGARTRAEGGEVLVRIRRLTTPQARARRLPVPLLLEVIEADFLDDTKTESLAGGGRIINGIEYDADGQRIAYHMFLEHPGESLAFNKVTGTQRVLARDILHIYRIDRPGQVRGVTDFAPVLQRITNLDGYEDAALEKARIEACLTAFVTSNADPAGGPFASVAQPGGDATTPRVVQFGSGMVNFLRPGESVETVTPSGAGQFEPFALHSLTAIAAGAGVTYDQATGDLRQANYSSLRAGKIEFKRMIQQDQWHMWVPRLCQPVWDAFIDQAILSGALVERSDGYRVEWSPPPMEMVDPSREIPAVITAMRAGLLPPQDAVGQMGENWRDTIRRYAEWNKAIDQAEVVLDSDPRRTAGTGAAQPKPGADTNASETPVENPDAP
jgi:lambda family phage portal protein